MKYDDASWHSGGEFPDGSPEEYGATHIALFFKWCGLRELLSEFQTTDEFNAANTTAMLEGRQSATTCILKNCDGKLTDEDLTDVGNSFAKSYYESHYFDDYMALYGELLYSAPESDHDFSKLTATLDQRWNSFNGESSRPWWRFW